MRRVRLAYSVALLALAALAVLVTGCGDSSDSATGTIDKAEFVKRANAFCERSKQRTGAALTLYSQRTGGEVLLEGSKRFRRAARAVILPGIEREIDGMRSLGVPSGDEETVEAYLRSMGKAVDAGSKGPPPAGARLERLFEPAARLARRLGIDSCVYS